VAALAAAERMRRRAALPGQPHSCLPRASRFQSRKTEGLSAVASRSVLHGSTLNTDTESLVKPRTRNSDNARRKVAQLCAQVRDIVSLALGDSADERLHDLVVHSVAPGPDSARLLVTVVPTDLLDVDSIERLYRALEGARPWLRQQVAAEIHRKRTPELAFQVLPRWEEDP
jgi:ribosome-binding factor A